MPRIRTRLPRITLPRTTYTGFTGGLATGLLATLPYTQLPAQRTEALEQTLSELAKAEMQRRTALEKELLEAQEIRSRALMNYLENYIPVTLPEIPTPTGRPRAVLEIGGQRYGMLTPEELSQIAITGQSPPYVTGSIPKWVIQPMYGLTRMSIQTEKSVLEDLRKSIENIRKQYNTFKAGLVETTLAPTEVISHLERFRASIRDLLNQWIIYGQSEKTFPGLETLKQIERDIERLKAGLSPK